MKEGRVDERMPVITTKPFHGEIRCDGCDTSLIGVTSKAELLMSSITQRWALTQDGQWFCPKCQEPD